MLPEDLLKSIGVEVFRLLEQFINKPFGVRFNKDVVGQGWDDLGAMTEDADTDLALESSS